MKNGVIRPDRTDGDRATGRSLFSSLLLSGNVLYASFSHIQALAGASLDQTGVRRSKLAVKHAHASLWRDQALPIPHDFLFAGFRSIAPRLPASHVSLKWDISVNMGRS